MTHNLPAGLLDNNIEFFASDELQAYCIDGGKVVNFEDFGEPLYQLIEQEMQSKPTKVDCLIQMGLTGRMEQIKQYLVCNYGGFDNSPDIKDGQLTNTEYWPCPKRGNCPYEGKLCDGLRTDTGEFLTKREIEYVKLTAQGLLDKDIADKMGLSLFTVTTHSRNTRNKTGLLRKADLTRFAITKNLV